MVLWFWLFLIALAGLLASLWRYVRLRQRLGRFAYRLRQMASRMPESLESDLLSLTEDTPPELTEVGESVYRLLRALHALLADQGIERLRLTALLDQIPDAVLIVGERGYVQWANQQAERLFGEGRTLVGRSIREVLRYPQLVRAWEKAYQEQEVSSQLVEWPISARWLSLIALPQPETKSVLVVVQDVTQVRRLEMVRRDFVANVSHELRTPLASLKAILETLQEGAIEDVGVRWRFLQRMAAEIEALIQLVNELLELTRLESGMPHLNLEAVSPLELARGSVERVRPQAERAGLELELVCPSPMALIRADGRRLEQVLLHLLHNAIKFTPPGGKVRLVVLEEAQVVRFEVQDTGVGIAAEDLPRVFERFYKGDRSRRRAEGSGLGLAIARHVVENHGGEIGVTSELGQGSRFYFTIPKL